MGNMKWLLAAVLVTVILASACVSGGKSGGGNTSTGGGGSSGQDQGTGGGSGVTSTSEAEVAKAWLIAQYRNYSACGLIEHPVSTNVTAVYPMPRPEFDTGPEPELPQCSGLSSATVLFEYNPCTPCNADCISDFAVTWVYVGDGVVKAAYEQNKLERRFILLQCG